mgnify:CR=1 FL=1|jgi:hypothetical protein
MDAWLHVVVAFIVSIFVVRVVVHVILIESIYCLILSWKNLGGIFMQDVYGYHSVWYYALADQMQVQPAGW